MILGHEGSVPFSESSDAFFQVSSRFIFGIYHHLNGDIGQRMSDEGSNVLRELAECIVTSLLACKLGPCE